MATIITDAAGLQAMKNNLSADYELGADIDCSSIANFEPVGTLANPFTGTLDGKGYIVSNLTINRPTTNYVGLFGYTDQSGNAFNDIVINNANITGQDAVGILAGGKQSGSWLYCTTSGQVSGRHYVGGVLGYIVDAGGNSISYISSNASVSGTNFIGGVCGHIARFGIINGFATGDVSGTSYVGGLVGYAGNPSYNYVTPLTNCYASGAVSGSSNVGGLVGYQVRHAASNSFWDTQTSGQATSALGTGKTSAEMKQQATFTSWDFSVVWDITEDSTYPWLIALGNPFPYCTPSYGPLNGGTSLVITGVGFTGATGVTIDGNAAINFSVISNTEIHCTSPRGVKGLCDVVVIKP